MQIGDYLKQSISISLKCLGTGNGYPSSRRAHACFFYEFVNTGLMVDCGEPASANFMRYGIDWNYPDALFISHLHFDHCGGLFMLLQSMYLERRSKPLKIYVPRDGIEVIQNLLIAATFTPEIVQFKIYFEELKNSSPVIINDIHVLPVLNTHLDSFKEKVGEKYPYKYESFSFLINSGEKKIFHTCDLGGIQDLEYVVKEKVNVLVCELSHVKPKQLFQYLQNSRLEWLILTHLDRRYRLEMEEIRSLATKMLPETRIAIPDDGAEIFLEIKQTSV